MSRSQHWTQSLSTIVTIVYLVQSFQHTEDQPALQQDEVFMILYCVGAESNDVFVFATADVGVILNGRDGTTFAAVMVEAEPWVDVAVGGNGLPLEAVEEVVHAWVHGSDRA